VKPTAVLVLRGERCVNTAKMNNAAHCLAEGGCSGIWISFDHRHAERKKRQRQELTAAGDVDGRGH
jgi:hypothetical protein